MSSTFPGSIPSPRSGATAQNAPQFNPNPTPKLPGLSAALSDSEQHRLCRFQHHSGTEFVATCAVARGAGHFTALVRATQLCGARLRLHGILQSMLITAGVEALVFPKSISVGNDWPRLKAASQQERAWRFVGGTEPPPALVNAPSRPAQAEKAAPRRSGRTERTRGLAFLPLVLTQGWLPLPAGNVPELQLAWGFFVCVSVETHTSIL